MVTVIHESGKGRSSEQRHVPHRVLSDNDLEQGVCGFCSSGLAAHLDQVLKIAERRSEFSTQKSEV